MKFQPDRADGFHMITLHQPGWVQVDDQRYPGSVVVPWQGEVRGWAPRRLSDLAAADFEGLVALQPELVLFGSGPRLRFAPPALMRPLIEARIGVETMDTAAACRTFNVLASVRRRVVAALLDSTDDRPHIGGP